MVRGTLKNIKKTFTAQKAAKKARVANIKITNAARLAKIKTAKTVAINKKANSFLI